MNEYEYSPQDKDDDAEAFRIELPPVYNGKLTEAETFQYNESYSSKGWKLLVGGAAIAISVAGLKYFRREHGEDE